MKSKYQALFSIFSNSVEAFIAQVDKKTLSLMATKEWTVKDVLCHIVFWHENYAANYQALAAGLTPPLPEGMSTINKRGVLSLKKYSRKELITRLRSANMSLAKSIVEKLVPQMTYSKGGRVYKTEDFLTVISRHITTHTKQVRRAK